MPDEGDEKVEWKSPFEQVCKCAQCFLFQGNQQKQPVADVLGWKVTQNWLQKLHLKIVVNFPPFWNMTKVSQKKTNCHGSYMIDRWCLILQAITKFHEIGRFQFLSWNIYLAFYARNAENWCVPSRQHFLCSSKRQEAISGTHKFDSWEDKKEHNRGLFSPCRAANAQTLSKYICFWSSSQFSGNIPRLVRDTPATGTSIYSAIRHLFCTKCRFAPDGAGFPIVVLYGFSMASYQCVSVDSFFNSQ